LGPQTGFVPGVTLPDDGDQSALIRAVHLVQIVQSEGMTVPAADPIPDYDALLRANLERVFNERDADRRSIAMADLYVAEPLMFEPDGVVRGRDAISATAGRLLEQFGPTFSFVPEGAAVGHHGLAVLRWHAGPQGGPIAVTGADAAQFEGSKIARLWVLLDPRNVSS
jgi:hypothetical protein